MSGFEDGMKLFDQRHGHVPAPEPTANEVRDNPVVRGRLLAQARKDRTGEAGRKARELLATNREAASTLARVDESDAREGVGSYDDLASGQRMSISSE